MTDMKYLMNIWSECEAFQQFSSSVRVRFSPVLLQWKPNPGLNPNPD